MLSRGKIGFIACNGGRPFAEKVNTYLKEIFLKEESENSIRIHPSREFHFANTEVKTEIDESIRGQDIYIFQDVENKIVEGSVNDKLMALITAIDSSVRADAYSVTAVIPTFPYSRQEKQIRREGITAAVVAKLIESAGAKKVITLDLHNPAIEGFFRQSTLENLNAAKNITDYIKQNLDLNDMVLLSPDTGGVTRARIYAEKLQRPLTVMYKQRDYSRISIDKDNITQSFLIGEVRDKNVVVVDDMIATGGTSIKAAQELKFKYGAKKIILACSLPLFNSNAIEKLKQAHLEGIVDLVIGTDAVYHGGEKFLEENKWYREVSVAKCFSRVIFNLNHNISISKLLL